MTEKCQVCGQPIIDPKDAAEIERLTAENERLRAAIKPFAEACDTFEAPFSKDVDTLLSGELNMAEFRAAKRAYQQSMMKESGNV